MRLNGDMGRINTKPKLRFDAIMTHFTPGTLARGLRGCFLHS